MTASDSARGEAQPFFDGARDQRLMLLRCGHCHAWQWPAAWLAVSVRRRCSECLSDELEWREASGSGAVYSWVVVHQVYAEELRGRVPYLLVMADLAEGVRTPPMPFLGEAADLRVDLPVRIAYDHFGDQVLPALIPA